MFLSGRPPWWQALHKTGLLVTLAGAVLMAGSVQARGSRPETVSAVALASLPAEAQATHRLIHAGGPFPHRKDGAVFANRERALPGKPRGYYHEYTVETPGARDRGARRIVCGGVPATRPDACFYTADHYTSFRRIVQ
ncbi:Ribonuclease N OS=Rhizobacter sp. Root404 OX=1736528 GN=ASC76_13310 PE=3 SV=1 [Rhizobacter fulvus]